MDSRYGGLKPKLRVRKMWGFYALLTIWTSFVLCHAMPCYGHAVLQRMANWVTCDLCSILIICGMCGLGLYLETDFNPNCKVPVPSKHDWLPIHALMMNFCLGFDWKHAWPLMAPLFNEVLTHSFCVTGDPSGLTPKTFMANRLWSQRE